MKNYFLFFRLWPGFSEPFPFDRFSGTVRDDELLQALNSWARDEIRRPEVRRAIMQVARCRKKQLLAATKKRSGTYASRPASSPGGRSCRNISRRSPGTRQLTERDLYWPRIRQPERPEPLICRFGHDRGWWSEVYEDFIPFGPPVWFYQVSSSELAETVVSFLNTQTNLDLVDDNGMEFGFQPRFGFVEDEDITLRISARLCINSIAQGKVPEVRSGGVALLMGQKALALVDDILEAAMPPTPASPQENSCAISREETVNPDQEALATEVEEDGGGDTGQAEESGTCQQGKPTAGKRVALDGRTKAGQEDAYLFPKGVSLQDVAACICPDEPSRIQSKVREWRNSRTSTLPKTIGKDSNNRSRNLYDVEQLISFLCEVESEYVNDDCNLRDNLNRVKRPIADAEN